MNALSLVTNKGFLASRELDAQIEQAMSVGELRTRGYVLTTRSEFYPYVGEQQVTKMFSEAARIFNESDALALIANAEIIHRSERLVRVELLIETLDDSSIAEELAQLRIGRYSPDADANGLSFLHNDFVHVQADVRRRIMQSIHGGHGTVQGHRILTLSDWSADAPTMESVTYLHPVPVSSGQELKQLFAAIRAAMDTDNLVTILLDMAVADQTKDHILVEMYTPTPIQAQSADDELEEYDWLDREDSLFHLLKFGGKAKTEREILRDLTTTSPFARSVTFGFEALENGKGDPFMPRITLSAGESSDIEEIERRLTNAFDLNSSRTQVNGRVVWDFYPGEGPFVVTAAAASFSIDEFSTKLVTVLDGLDLHDAIAHFHIYLF